MPGNGRGEAREHHVHAHSAVSYTHLLVAWQIALRHSVTDALAPDVQACRVRGPVSYTHLGNR